MNPKIFKYLKLKAELSAEELRQADALAAMSEGDKLALLELWDLKPKSKPATTRRIAKCGTCNFTRRALHHRDSSVKGYHVFDEGKRETQPPKSSRASSLAQQLAGTASGNHKPLVCDYEIDGKVCKGTENDGIHDKSLGYGNYHEFQSSPATPATQAVGEE